MVLLWPAFVRKKDQAHAESKKRAKNEAWGHKILTRISRLSGYKQKKRRKVNSGDAGAVYFQNGYLFGAYRNKQYTKEKTKFADK